jgi:hypothetical protein
MAKSPRIRFCTYFNVSAFPVQRRSLGRETSPNVFDLHRTKNTFAYVGQYLTGQAETAGLEFDRSTGKLYIWHNIGSNYQEVTELDSYLVGAERRLRPLIK